MPMTIALVQYGPFLVALTCLVFGTLFATLFSACDLSGQAGLQRLMEKFPAAERRLVKWTPRWDILRSALLLATMIMEVAAISFAVTALVDRVGPFSLGLPFVLILALTVFIFLLALDIIPRALSEPYADTLTAASLPYTAALTLVLYPFAWLISLLEKQLVERFMAGADEEDRPSPEDEIISLVEQADEAEMEANERELIRNVFEFGDTVAREIMTPRVDIQGFENTLTVGEAMKAAASSTFSRFPVYQDTIDQIQGVLHMRDLLEALRTGDTAQPIARYAREALYIPESMHIDDLLCNLREAQAELAIVVDEYGGTEGIVTQEDIVDELVGDLLAGRGVGGSSITPLAEDIWLIEARTDVDEVNKQLGANLPDSEEYDTLGGYLFEQMGHIPKPGEAVECPPFRLTVQSASPHKILTVRANRLESDA